MYLNLIVYILSHALGTIGWYSVLSFCILTVFDINLLELIHFRNYRYFVSSCLFSCPTLSFLLLFSYFKYKNRKKEVFQLFLTVFILASTSTPMHGPNHTGWYSATPVATAERWWGYPNTPTTTWTSPPVSVAVAAKNKQCPGQCHRMHEARALHDFLTHKTHDSASALRLLEKQIL